MVEDEVIAQQLEALVTSAITVQENYYRQLGLRVSLAKISDRVAKLVTGLLN